MRILKLFGIKDSSDMQALVGIVMVLVLLIGGLYTIISYDRLANERDLSIPVEADPIAWNSEMNAVQKIVSHPLGAPADYYDIKERLEKLNAQQQKLRVSAPENHYMMTARGTMKAGLTRGEKVEKASLANEQRRADYPNPMEFMFDYSSARYYYRHADLSPTVNQVIELWPLLQWLVYFHILGMILIPFHYHAQLVEQGCSMQLELLGPFYAPVLFWEIGFLIYPNTNPSQQLERVRRYLAYGFGAFASFMAYVMPAAAQTETPSPVPTIAKTGRKYEIKIDTEVMSQSIADDGAVFSTNPFFSTVFSVEGKHCGTALGFAQALRGNNRQPDGANVVSLTGFCKKEIRGFEFNGSVSYQNGDPFTRPLNDVIALGGAVKMPTWKLGDFTVQPKITADHFFPLKNSGVKGGTWFGTGLSLESKLGEKAKIVFEPKAIYDTGAFGFQPGFVGSFKTRLELDISQNFTWRVMQVNGVIPLNHFVDGRKTAFAFGSGFSYTF